MPDRDRCYHPKMSDAGRAPTHAVTAVDEHGRVREVSVAGELPLTPFFFDCLHLNGRDLIDLPGTERDASWAGVVPTSTRSR